MTNANTPATREREAAREIAQFCISMFEITDDQWDVFEPDITNRIAAALARERREALTEAAQVAREKIIDAAALSNDWDAACDEIAAAIERLRDASE